MGKGKVPNQPHLVIVPNTLFDQWHRELKTAFKSHAIDIFPLPTAWEEIKSFWATDSWLNSHQNGVFKVVLCSQSVR